jgi:hypothetical protein
MILVKEAVSLSKAKGKLRLLNHAQAVSEGVIMHREYEGLDPESVVNREKLRLQSILVHLS